MHEKDSKCSEIEELISQLAYVIFDERSNSYVSMTNIQSNYLVGEKYEKFMADFLYEFLRK